MRIQVLKFDVVVVHSLTKRINGLDLAFGGHGFKKGRYKCLWFFVNISKSMMIQRLKFGPIVLLDLLNISNGLDHDFRWLNLQKKGKNHTALVQFQNSVNNHGTSTVKNVFINISRSTWI